MTSAELDRLAENLYGVRRKDTETDEELKERCLEKLRGVVGYVPPTKTPASAPIWVVAQTGRTSSAAPNHPYRAPGKVEAVKVDVKINGCAPGAVCTKCNEHNEYAEPSKTYVCYRCRV